MKIKFETKYLSEGRAAAQSPKNLRILCTREVQSFSLLRADEKSHCDRGNLSTQVRFSVVRTHPTHEAAAAFCLLHAAELENLSGVVSFIAEDGALEADFFLRNAVLKSVQTRLEGLSTETEYLLFGGKFSSLKTN